MTSHDQPVDWDRALETSNGNRDLLMELVAIFLEEGPDLMPKIAKAVEANKTDDVKKHAHRLKGSLKYFGKSAVEKRVIELENLAAEERLAEMPAKFAELKAALDDFMPKLRAGPP
jgi:HPt (histidine-containing phosphotransfer) domain-containing protein